MNPSYNQLNDYSHYLQSQVQKFSAFMLTQKKLNEKHLLIQNHVYDIVQRLNKYEDKLKAIEVNEKDNLLELRKIKAEKESLRTMEIRIQNIQHQIQSIFKSEKSISLNQSSANPSPKPRQNQSQSTSNRQIKINQYKKAYNYQREENYMQEIEKYLSSVFTDKQQVHQMIDKAKDDIQFKIKKLQIQIQKSKEGFLKLTANINNLSNLKYLQTVNKSQFKGENRVQTQSTRDLNIEPISQQKLITKKQLRKMEKKLENFFTSKFSQIKSQTHNRESQSSLNDKGIKFKKIQQKYDRLTAENFSNRSQRKMQHEDRRYSSQKKISLFDNEILRQKHNMENHDLRIEKKHKSKSKNNNESPIAMIESPKHTERIKRNIKSKSQSRKFDKKKSPQRIKKFNVDYMMTQ